MEVDSADKRSNGIKCRMFGGIRWTKERVRDVTRNENAFDAQINPGSREIGKIDPPFLFPLVGVRLENEMVNTIHLPEISLMILPVMLVRDFGIQTKEQREKRVLRVGRINVDWWLRYDGCHITKGDGGEGAIIKENSVRRGRCKRVVGGTAIR